MVKKEATIVDAAIPKDVWVAEKRVEKLEKYQLLKNEIIKMWGVKKVVIVPLVIGALGVVSKNFEKCVKKLENARQHY